MQRSFQTSKTFCFIFLAFAAAFLTIPVYGQDASGDLRQQAKAENKPVLIYYHGSDWCVSGETILKIWNNPKVQSKLNETFLTGTYDVPSVNSAAIEAANAPAKSLRVDITQYPAIACYTPSGECFAIWGNIPFDVTASAIVKRTAALLDVWKKAETLKDKAFSQSGVEAANTAAEFFNTLIPFSSIEFIRSDKSFQSVWRLMEKQDPDDQTGWRRFYNFDYQWYGDKISEFRNNDKFEEGEAFIIKEQNDPRNSKLTVEQKQVLALLPFCLNSNLEESKDANIALLKEVVKMDPTTRWGIGAAGWLQELGEESPIPIPTLEERMAKVFLPLKKRGSVKVKSFAQSVMKSDRDAIKQMLRSKLTLSGNNKKIVLRYYAMSIIGAETIDQCIALEGGKANANLFFSSTELLESFLLSGPINNPARSYQVWDMLMFQCSSWKNAHTPSEKWLDTPLGKNLVMAIALNAQFDDTTSVYLLESFYRLAQTQRLVKNAYNYNAREFRYVVLNIHPYDNLWLNEFRSCPPDDYTGACWSCRYITYNFFGDSVQGRLYRAPWDKVYTSSEVSQKIGGVCGALSYFGASTARAHGVMAVPGGQPAHCAYMLRGSQDRWIIGYSVSPYTGAHFNFWDLSYQGLDMIESIYKDGANKRADLIDILAKTILQLRYPLPTISNLTATSYEWGGRTLPNFSTLTKEEETRVYSFDINAIKRRDRVAIRFTGTLNVTDSSPVNYTIASDDGSRLLIDGNVIIDNDGPHGVIEKSASVSLEPGKHAIEVQYFNAGGGRSLTVTMSKRQSFDSDINSLYKNALKYCPSHYGVALDYALWLDKVDAPYDVWKDWADRVANGLKDYADNAWRLLNRFYFPKCKASGGKDELLKQLLTYHSLMRQSDLPTSEVYNYRAVLDQHYNMLDKDNAAAMELFKTCLKTQFNTSSLFGVVLTWGADRFMNDEKLSQQMGAAIADVFADVAQSDGKSDALAMAMRELMRKASQTDNMPLFTQIAQLIRKQNPVKDSNPYPTEDFGGKILSDKAMMKISTSGGFDYPNVYPFCLDTTRDVDRTFHTDNETSPWAIVTLPGMSEITGILVAPNRGYYRDRNVPIMVWVSENGTDWTEVFTSAKLEPEWRIDLRSAPVKAKYVKVGRVPEFKKDCFHLGKILIYGKPLY